MDGLKFFTLGYDKFVKLWDTETGQCLASLAHKCLMYQVVVPPWDPGNTVLGCAQDKQVLQWDLRAPSASSPGAGRSGSTPPALSYDQHLDAVLTCTFVTSTRFLTTSEDRTMRVWDYGVPQTIRMIQDPAIDVIPNVALHPQDPMLAMHTFDDVVIVLHSETGIRQRKTFSGHETMGHACNLAFSPDGRFLASGDGKGRLMVWDWQSGGLVRSLGGGAQHHDAGKVVKSVDWNPVDGSGVASAAWDGTVKYWQ